MIRHDFEQGMYVRTCINPQAKDTLVYIHGLGESGLCFEELIGDTRLSAWNHVVPDLPGYGKSPWPEKPMTLGGHARHLAGWLRKKDMKSFILLGHSMGGVIGLIFSEEFLGMARGFLNVEGNISKADCVFSGRAAGYPPDAFISRGFEQLCDWIYQGGQDDRALRNYFCSMRICDPRIHHLNSTELVRLARSGGLAKRQRALPVPNVYILGDPRGVSPDSRRILDEAGVGWRAVENAGHWPFIDQRDTFIKEMLSFANPL